MLQDADTLGPGDRTLEHVLFRQTLAPCVMAVALSSVGPGRPAGNMAAVRFNRGSQLNFIEMNHKIRMLTLVVMRNNPSTL